MRDTARIDLVVIILGISQEEVLVAVAFRSPFAAGAKITRFVALTRPKVERARNRSIPTS